MAREFNAQNVLSLSQILNNSSQNKLVIKRTEPITFNIIDQKPKFNKKK